MEQVTTYFTTKEEIQDFEKLRRLTFKSRDKMSNIMKIALNEYLDKQSDINKK